jgi:hypothetical protein
MNDRRSLCIKRRDVEREKARIALHIPHVIAREASHLYSKRPAERLLALQGLASGIREDAEAYIVAFFECIEHWLRARGYHEAAQATAAFARQLLEQMFSPASHTLALGERATA